MIFINLSTQYLYVQIFGHEFYYMDVDVNINILYPYTHMYINNFITICIVVLLKQ